MLWYEWLIIGIVFAVALVGMVFSILPYLSPVSVAHGGTAAKTVETARVNLGIPDVLPITQGGTGSVDVTSARKALSIPAILPVTAGGTGATNAADAVKALGIGLGTTMKNYQFTGPATNPGSSVSNCLGFYDMINAFNCDIRTVSATTGGCITVYGTISASVPRGYAGSTQIRGLLPLPADPSTYTIYGGILGGFSGLDTDMSSWTNYGCLGYIVQHQSTKGVYLYANYFQGFTTLPSAFQVQFVVFMNPS